MSRVPLEVLPQVRAALSHPHPAPSCDHCGACCEHVGTPPSFVAVYCSAQFKAWQADPDSFDAQTDDYYRKMQAADDYMQWCNTPEALKDETQAYYDARQRGEVGDRYDDGLACLWFDAVTRQCRNYANRPDACRTEVELGDDLCRDFRAKLAWLIREENS